MLEGWHTDRGHDLHAMLPWLVSKIKAVFIRQWNTTERLWDHTLTSDFFGYVENKPEKKTPQSYFSIINLDGRLFIPLWQIKYAKLLLHLMKSLNALSTLTQSTQIYLLKEVCPVTNTFICGGSKREPCKHGFPRLRMPMLGN